MRTIKNMPLNEYLAADAISHGGIAAALKAPELFLEYAVNGVRKRPSNEMLIGQALHSELEDPGSFMDKYVIKPDGVDRRSTKGREAIAEMEASGKTLLTEAQCLTAMCMANAIRVHPNAKRLLEGEFEVSHFWDDEATGLLMRSRPDITRHNSVIEIKTTSDPLPRGFSNKARAYGYHIQAYMELVASGKSHFVWIIVQNEPPYIVRLYAPSDTMLLAGEEDFIDGRDIIAACKTSGVWTPTNLGIEIIDLPAWR